MRSWLSHIFIFSMVVIVFQSCLLKRNRIPSLEESYDYQDKRPFGGYVAYNEIENFFHKEPVVVTGTHPFEQSLNESYIPDSSKEKSLYFILTDNFFPDEEEKNKMLSFVEDGNDLFISANTYGNIFLKDVDVKINPTYIMDMISEDWGGMKNTEVRIAPGRDMPEIPFGIYYYPFLTHVINAGETGAGVLGKNEKGEPDFILIFRGKGRIYMHFAPRALSNYFLLTENNLRYLGYILGYIDNWPQFVYWDELYSRPRQADSNPDFSRLNVIMRQPALRWAFFLSVFGLMVYFVTSLVKRQRVIPLSESSENVSVDFTETVARLYYVHKDNKNIASKLITYFYENVRRKYLLSRSDDKGEFELRLAGKRNWTQEEAHRLMEVIENIQQSEAVSDEELFSLNEQLEKFYNKR